MCRRACKAPGRTTHHPAYAIGHRVRQPVEDRFGGMTACTGMRKTRHKGRNWSPRRQGSLPLHAGRSRCQSWWLRRYRAETPDQIAPEGQISSEHAEKPRSTDTCPGFRASSAFRPDDVRAVWVAEGGGSAQPDACIEAVAPQACQRGLRNTNAMRSLSPIALKRALSNAGSAGWPSGAVRRTGGRVHTPNG